MPLFSLQQIPKYFFRKKPEKSHHKSIKNRIRRGRGGNKNNINNSSTNLTIIGNNVAGLNGKLKSLEKIIENFAPGIILLQETKMRNTNQIKLPGFTIFEQLRENNEGGGLMSIVHNNLKPALISGKNTEFLEVENN